MKVVWNEENKKEAVFYGKGPFLVLDSDDKHYYIHTKVKFQRPFGFYKHRFDIVSESLIELEDML
jgi:hypothetical protein